MWYLAAVIMAVGLAIGAVCFYRAMLITDELYEESKKDCRKLKNQNRRLQSELKEVTHYIETDFALKLEAMNAAQAMLREAKRHQQIPSEPQAGNWDWLNEHR